jgi:hypothetical protein
MAILDSLPWDYDILVELPRCTNVQAGITHIGKNFSLQFSINQEAWFDAYREYSDQCDYMDSRVYSKYAHKDITLAKARMPTFGVMSAIDPN